MEVACLKCNNYLSTDVIAISASSISGGESNQVHLHIHWERVPAREDPMEPSSLSNFAMKHDVQDYKAITRRARNRKQRHVVLPIGVHPWREP